MVGENGDDSVFRPGDFKELFADPTEVVESLIEGFEDLRPPAFLEKMPILSRLPYQTDNKIAVEDSAASEKITTRGDVEVRKRSTRCRCRGASIEVGCGSSWVDLR